MLSGLLLDRTPAARLKLGSFKAIQSCFYYFSGVPTMCAILIQPTEAESRRYGYREYTRNRHGLAKQSSHNKFQKSGSVETLVLV